jgi:hypothetical protein
MRVQPAQLWASARTGREQRGAEPKGQTTNSLRDALRCMGVSSWWSEARGKPLQPGALQPAEMAAPIILGLKYVCL